MSRPTAPSKRVPAVPDDLRTHPNPLARIKGIHHTAFAALGAGLRQGLSFEDRRPPRPTPDDTMLDPSLDRGSAKAGASAPPAQAGVVYAGLTADQRAFFVEWLAEPRAPAPSALQQLYVAYLEVALFDTVAGATAARREIHDLMEAPAWQRHAGLIRAWLLAHWLIQDGQGLADWLNDHPLDPDLLAVALSLQAQMGVALQPRQAALALASTTNNPTPTDPEVMKHRLGSLAADVGDEILAYALAQVAEVDRLPKPWRCSHRDLRIALPQPPVLPALKPLLRELAAHPLSAQTQASSPGMRPEQNEDGADADDANPDWNLILEFGASRSQYFDYVLSQAQKQPGFSQIMDENRRMIYRVHFAKQHMKRFWRIWEYVQSWASTQVFLNGQELDHWKIWPYSQYLN